MATNIEITKSLYRTLPLALFVSNNGRYPSLPIFVSLSLFQLLVFSATHNIVVVFKVVQFIEFLSFIQYGW